MVESFDKIVDVTKMTLVYRIVCKNVLPTLLEKGSGLFVARRNFSIIK